MISSFSIAADEFSPLRNPDDVPLLLDHTKRGYRSVSPSLLPADISSYLGGLEESKA